MPEIKKVWLVTTPSEYHADMNWVFEDYKEKDDQLAQFCGALKEGGYDMDKFMRIAFGTTAATWWKEKSKVYDDEASARKDAEKRLEAARKKYESRKTATRVVARFKAG